MQTHRSDLPAAAILRPSPPPRIGSVQALGLSDALRVELQACQLADFVDELDELRGPLGEAYECARRRWLELSVYETGTPGPALSAAEEKLGAAAYALRVNAAIRAQIPEATNGESIVVVGPATTVSTLISAATRNAADRVAELLRDSARLGPELHTALGRDAAALQAWIETYVDCYVIEWYLFDPNWDPVTVVA